MSEKTFGEYEVGDEFLYGEKDPCVYRITAQTKKATLLEEVDGIFLPKAIEASRYPRWSGLRPVNKPKTFGDLPVGTVVESLMARGTVVFSNEYVVVFQHNSDSTQGLVHDPRHEIKDAFKVVK